MNSLLLVVITAIGYLLAYRLYGRWLGGRLFGLARGNPMPAHRFRDGIDFIPTRRHIVLGHHFTTIAGLGPILGPAIGIIWGWLPALLWIFFGSIFIGAVHDFATMVISARHEGRTIGDLTGTLVNRSTRYAFLVIIQFLLWIVVSIFAMIMGILFTLYPQAVIPVWLQIPIAVWLGIQIRQGRNELLYSLLAVGLMYGAIWLGMLFPVNLPPLLGSPVVSWCLLLFVYAFVASTLPIDVLLQPRDYINSHQLLLGIGLLALGLIVAHPPLTAPAINPAAFAPGSDIPPMLPLLFITIACGAISGFHSLASTGTSVKQIRTEPDMLPIGYGAMLIEGLLAVIALCAVAGGLGMGLIKDGTLFTGAAAFQVHYATWSSAQGMAAQIEAVVTGAANLMASLGLPPEVGQTLMAVFIVSFAGTTLDTATRIQRLCLQELCRNRHGVVARPVRNRHAATLIVVAMAALLAMLQPGAKGALILWPLFGALNQLLAALGLCIATVYLAGRGKNSLVTFIPMLFMLAMTVWAMGLNLRKFWADDNHLLVAITIIILLLTGWLLIGAATAVTARYQARRAERLQVGTDL
jgi:carbon starvation protein